MFSSLAFLDVGGPELLLIFLLVLLLFGGQRLPEFAKGLGKSIREFKKATAGVEEELKRAMDEPVQTKPALPPPPKVVETTPAPTAAHEIKPGATPPPSPQAS